MTVPSPAYGSGGARPKHLLVVGAGAAGSFLGTLLGNVGYEVTLVRIFEQPSETPVTLVRPDGTRRVVRVHRVTRTEDSSRPDLILVAVKMPVLRDALAPTQAWPDVPTLTVENGIGAEETAAEIRPSAPQIAGSLTAPIRLASEDEVRWLGRGGIALAAANLPAQPFVAPLLADFARAGLRTAELPDARAMKWSKLLANLLANATGAILDMDPAAIYADRQLFAVERRQLLETLAVMTALGVRPVRLPGAAVPWLARAIRLPAPLGRPILRRIVGGARGGKMPSLRLHLQMAGEGPSTEQTEVAWMNGAVARFGRQLGVPTPVNARLAELVEDVAAHPDRRALLRRNPGRFLAELAEPAAPVLPASPASPAPPGAS
jgi:2-dehydropantoate 2-reductase